MLLLALLFILLTRPALALNVQPPIDLPANSIDAGTKTLNSIATAIGANQRTLVISQPLPALTGNLTIPSTLALQISGAGLIACGSFTLTIQSDTSQWPSRQIFADDCLTTGSVSFLGMSQVATLTLYG